jgi:hypothetical protein
VNGVVDVGPLRRDIDDIGAGIDQQLERQIQRLHAARRDGGARDGNRSAVQARLVLRQRFVQGPMATHIGNVEGQAVIEGCLGSVADESRRHHVAFAIPERDHVAELARTHGKVGDVLGVQITDLSAHAIESIARA